MPLTPDQKKELEAQMQEYVGKPISEPTPGRDVVNGENDPFDGNGWCVEEGDCNDGDANVHPGHNDTKGRWGRNGVDNDCNGITDG